MTRGSTSRAASWRSANSSPTSLRNEATAAQKTEADVRAELAEAENRHRAATEGLRAEKSLVEEQLNQSHDERAKLQREIATMKREAETAWANERMENAVLRERINDVAAEVARLTAVLEGPDSPIDAILTADAARVPAKGANGTGVAATELRPIAPSGARIARARSPTASAPCRAAPRAFRSRARRLSRGQLRQHRRLRLTCAARCLKSCGLWCGRLAQRESVPFTRERSQVQSLQRPPF